MRLAVVPPAALGPDPWARGPRRFRSPVGCCWFGVADPFAQECFALGRPAVAVAAISHRASRALKNPHIGPEPIGGTMDRLWRARDGMGQLFDEQCHITLRVQGLFARRAAASGTPRSTRAGATVVACAVDRVWCPWVLGLRECVPTTDVRASARRAIPKRSPF